MGKTPNRIENNKSQNHINHRAERFANLRVIPPIGCIIHQAWTALLQFLLQECTRMYSFIRFPDHTHGISLLTQTQMKQYEAI